MRRRHAPPACRLANPHSPTTTSHVTLSDLEQLGCMAAAQHLHQQATQLGARNGSGTVQARHEAVLRVLANGHVVSAEKQTNQFGHVTFKVVLEDSDTGEKCVASPVSAAQRRFPTHCAVAHEFGSGAGQG